MTETQIQDALSLVHSFMELPAGWCHGYESPPTQQTYDLAEKLLHQWQILPMDVDVLPFDKGIVLSFSHDEDCVDVEIEDGALVHVQHERGIGANFSVEASIDAPSVETVTQLLRQVTVHAV